MSVDPARARGVLLAAAVLYLVGATVWGIRVRILDSTLPIGEISRAPDAVGTMPRLEREFKLSVESADPAADFQAVKSALLAMVKDPSRWKAPALVRESYYLTDSPRVMLFQDVYLDSPDRINARHGVSYRLRRRWRSVWDYRRYSVGVRSRESLPVRCEVQAKTARRDFGGGYSEAIETRLEFRNGSPPFDELNPAPGPPWPLLRYIRIAATGRFEGSVIRPAKAYAEYLRGRRGVPKRLKLEPAVLVLSRRRRLHLNLRTPWGSGQNPENAFIVTLDSVEAGRPLDLTERPAAAAEAIARMLPVGTEIEIEFERNVSSRLDAEIRRARESGDVRRAQEALAVRKAFLEDLRSLTSAVEDVLRKRGVKTEPQDQSKYRRALARLAAAAS